MVSRITAYFPIVGNFVDHLDQRNTKELVRDGLRLVVAAVAAVALGFFPAITARLTTLPYVGQYVSAGLARFQLLSPLAQYAAVGVLSAPALALAGGAYFLASGVAAAYQANMAMSVLGGLDVAVKLATGIALLKQCHKVNIGAVEMVK
jgi:hypothetical protein